MDWEERRAAQYAMQVAMREFKSTVLQAIRLTRYSDTDSLNASLTITDNQTTAHVAVIRRAQ